MCSLFCFKDQTSFFEFTPLYGLYPIVFNNLFVSGSKYLISSAIMATIVVLIKYCYLNINIWLRLILEVNIGICTYAIMLFILKDQLFITLTKYIKERIFRN